MSWVTTGLVGPFGIALDSTYAYVTNSNGSISKILLSSGGVVPWVTGLNSPKGIALDSTYAYVTNSNNNSISIINLTTGVVVPWVTTGLSSPIGIALDSTNAYVTNTNNTISIINLTTKIIAPWVTTGLIGPIGIALNTSYTYVTNTANSTINRYFNSPPTNVVADPGINSVNLSWIPVSGAANYNVLYGTDPNNLTIIYNSLTPSSTITGLNSETTYYFAVQAVEGLTTSSSSTPLIQTTTDPEPLPCFLADSKVLTDKGLVSIQLLKKGDLVQTLNDGLLPIKFVGVRSFFNKLTEERINPHLYKLNKIDFPELLEDLFITGGHPLLVDEKVLDEETKKKLLDMVYYGTPIITEGKYRVFACVHPKAELWNDEKEHEIFDIVLENEDPKKNIGIWVNGILTESMDEEYFLNESKMIEINI